MSPWPKEIRRRLVAEVEQVAVKCCEEAVVLWVLSAGEPCQYGAWYCELCFFCLSNNAHLEIMRIYFAVLSGVSLWKEKSLVRNETVSQFWL